MSEASHRKPNYAAVFWSLFFLTILEIIAANSPFRKFVIVVCLLLLAIVKASLVALFYMHLKFERQVVYLIIAFPLVLAAILTVMIFLDKVPIG
jgi:cytochrome c oxidase subunit 4